MGLGGRDSGARMPRLIITPAARAGLVECREFLRPKNPLAAQNASREISDAFQRLIDHPKLGRPFEDLPQLRELPIPFGTAGYVALYRLDGDDIVILAFRHMKEAGYS